LARVELTRVAIEDLDRLIAALSLPTDSRERVRTSLGPLFSFPLLGPALEGRWQGMRFLLGPWRWMLMVYEYRPDDDRVVIVTIQDARSSSAASGR
jgi:hypothetical protein